MALRDETAATLHERSTTLAAERTGKERLLARVRQDRSAHRAVLVELERAARALEVTLEELGDARSDSGERLDGTEFAALQGGLAPPVRASVAKNSSLLIAIALPHPKDGVHIAQTTPCI